MDYEYLEMDGPINWLGKNILLACYTVFACTSSKQNLKMPCRWKFTGIAGGIVGDTSTIIQNIHIYNIIALKCVNNIISRVLKCVC